MKGKTKNKDSLGGGRGICGIPAITSGYSL